MMLFKGAAQDICEYRRQPIKNSKNSELASTRLRSTTVGIGYNISLVIFGGFAPFICTFLVHQTGDATAPAYFVVACSAISVLTVASLRDRAHLPLKEL